MNTEAATPVREDSARLVRGSSVRRSMRWAYVVASGILALAILAQVFLAGGGMFAEPSWWPTHRMMGMLLSLGPLALLAVGFAARLPARTLWLNGLLLVLVVLQPVLISVAEQAQLPVLASLHVVNAVVLFALTAILGQQVWTHLMRTPALAQAATRR